MPYVCWNNYDSKQRKISNIVGSIHTFGGYCFIDMHYKKYKKRKE